jgi:hypothetical protein
MFFPSVSISRFAQPLVNMTGILDALVAYRKLCYNNEEEE